MSDILQCRDVRKTYRNGKQVLHVLRGVDVDVREHEVLAISGLSGAGKSTLLHIMSSLDRPTSGTVLFRGKEISRLDKKEINRLRNEEIGFVFQFYHLVPEFSAIENVMLPALVRGVRRKQARKRAMELLESVGLEQRIRHRPSELSGGEQQRVAIARALYSDPALVFADEPTGNLDAETSEDIQALLLGLNRDRNTTLVVVTHNEGFARAADRWMRLVVGTIEESG